MNHQNLVDKCKHGDRRAQEELFRSYVGAMYNVAVRMVGDRDEAEEVVQEAFIKVFAKISQYEGKSTIGAWIKRIVVNQALNHLKKNKLVFEPIDGLEAEEEENDDWPELAAKQIHLAIKELPKAARAVVSLHLIEGYKHREIAEMLGIGESTSRSQYIRGRNMLRVQLRSRVNDLK